MTRYRLRWAAFIRSNGFGFVAAFVALCVNATYADLSVVSTLHSSAPSAGDSFGARIARVGDGEDVVCAAPSGLVGSAHAGAAYIFNLNTGALRRTIANPSPESSDRFGAAIAPFAISQAPVVPGIAIAAPSDTDDNSTGGPSGTVYVFNAATGEQLSSVGATSLNAGMGEQIAADSDYLIGPPFTQIVIARSDGGAITIADALTGAVQATLTNPTGAPGFGADVKVLPAGLIDDEPSMFVLVGSPLDGSGKAYLYESHTGALVHIFSNPGSENVGFGEAVSFSQNGMLIGAPREGAGVVYLFDGVYSDDVVSTMPNPASESSTNFGRGIVEDLADNSILISATVGDSGVVYRFSPSGDLVTSVTDPNPSVPGFGSAVSAIYGSLLVSSPGNSNTPGAVYVFSNCGDSHVDPGEQCDDGNQEDGDCCSASCQLEMPSDPCLHGGCSSLSLRRTIASPLSQPSFFGLRLGTSEDGDVLVAAPAATVGGINAAGAAFLFDATTGEEQQAYYSPTPTEIDLFGFGLSQRGSSVFVGAPFTGHDGYPFSGELYNFNASDGSVIASIDPPDLGENVGLGWSILPVGSDVIVAAASGQAYRIDPTTSQIITTYTATVGGQSQFAQSMASDGERLFVGAPGIPSVYVFDVATGDLEYTIMSPASEFDGFGSAVELNDAGLFVSSPFPGRAGVVYKFDRNTYTLIGSVSNPNPCDSNSFGTSLTTVGSNLFVGAPGQDASSKGWVYGYQAATLEHVATLPNPDESVPQFGYALSNIGGSLAVSSIGDGIRDGVVYLFSACGDGSISPGEQCDDGNAVDGDGCSSSCETETSTTTTQTTTSSTSSAAPTSDTTTSTSTTATTTTSPNHPPLAIPNDPIVCTVGASVMLDGERSFDEDGDSMTFQWRLVSAPSGSSAIIDNPAAASTTFSPDLNGTYIFNLIVNDGEFDSDAAATTVTAFTELPTVSLSVDSPSSGSEIDGDAVDVEGTISGPGDLGISVNGFPAAVVSGHFVAGRIPLHEGDNTLRVVASSRAGELSSVERHVNATGGIPTVSATITPSYGVAPLGVAIEIQIPASIGMKRVSVDFDGDGVSDVSTRDLSTALATTFVASGVYHVSIVITDYDDVDHALSVPVVVEDQNEIDPVLSALWSSMLSELTVNHCDRAAEYLSPEAASIYPKIWSAIGPELSDQSESYGVLQEGTIGPNTATYILARSAGDDVTRVQFVGFLRGSDGIWRIDNF